MLPLVVRPALAELLNVPLTDPAINAWSGILFTVPAVAGGVFGLLGGYLTDRLGRRRVLVWSILLYAFAALASAYATSVGQLLFWRCCGFVGVCVEFVAAVAWLSELFPKARQREAIVGYTQAFGSIGGVLVTAAYYLIVTWSDRLPAIRGAHEAWRYTLMSGVVPAIPLIVIRPFLPESPLWRAKKDSGTLKRPSLAELFRPEFRRTTIVTTLMMACGYAVAYGAIQQMPRVVPGLAEVSSLPRQAAERAVSTVQWFHETGGLVGRLLLAYLAVRISARPHLLRMFLIPGMFVLPFVFIFPATWNLTAARWGIFCVGVTTVSQFSFWGNYLPRVYPVHLRGTGESFAMNTGGRLLGTSFAAITAQLAITSVPGEAPGRIALVAAGVGFFVLFAGFVLSYFLPEPGKELK